MKTNLLFATILSILLAVQTHFRSDHARQVRRPAEAHPKGEWTKGIDANSNGTIEADEFQAAIDRTFTDLDENKDGVIDRNEIPDRRPPIGRPHAR